ncbi:MAG: hypothetical protein QOF30_2534 [Acidimicrobiaceae bacterium]|jgi:hypothetical protein|nr:hypothetical protein [Acidimicrobiaceae bacterium]
MTTSHLDDEALSAALDGVATEAEHAHLSSCSICQAQMASLAFVARAVATPVGDRPRSEVDAAVEGALRAWSGSDDAVASDSVLEPEPSRRETLTLAAPTPIGVGSGRAAARRASRSPRWLGAAAGIAAAVIVVGGAVALSRGRTTSRASTTAGLAPQSSSSTRPTPDAAASGSSADLGDQSDPSVLAHRVSAAVGQRVSGSAAAEPGFGATTIAGPTAPSGDQRAAPTCVAQAATATGAADNPAPDLVATLRWRGEPAVVVVFSRPGGLAGAVMRQADCSLLVVLPL